MEFTSAARSLLRCFLVSNSQNHIKSVAAGALLASTALFATVDANAVTPSAVVGAIAGHGGISATGAATYDIPITIPPGTHGMQPSLALTYNSQGGDGWAGYGWTLSGLSTIARCPRNIDDNGSTIPVRYVINDNYCLDGQRLRLISGSHGQDGAIYGTEIEDFYRITLHADANATEGASWFTVESKDGRVYEYGKTPDSKIFAEGTTVARIWALDQVTDASGDSIIYQYGGSSTPGREYWPTFINYTKNGAANADHQVEFDYVTRPAGTTRTQYTEGSLSRNSKLLSAIKIKYLADSTTTLTYNLSYDQDPANNRNRLVSVQECGTDGGCLPATTIAWKDSHSGWSADISTGVSVSDQSYAQDAHLMDVDADGIKDLVYPDTASDGSINWMVMFGQASGGFGSPVDTGVSALPTFYDNDDTLEMDYNGDGRPDLMQPYASGVRVMRSTGNRTPGQNGIFTLPADHVPGVILDTNSTTGEPIYQGNVWVVDYGGGILSDIMYTDGANVQWMENTGPSNNDFFDDPVAVYSSANLKRAANKTFRDVGVDFNGSGRGGALLYSTSGSWVALKTNGNGNTLTAMGAIPASTVPAVPFDSNGDGLTDLLSVSTGDNWQISLSIGTGFNTLSSTEPYSGTADPLVADYYGNGTQVAFVYNSNMGYWDRLETSYNPGTGNFSLVTTANAGAPYPVTNYVKGSLRIGNIEANGLDDLVYAVSNSGQTSFTWHYALHWGATYPYPDQVSKITDGLGNYCQFTYTSLAKGAPTFTPGNNYSYPIHSIQNTMQVVSSYAESDGTGGGYSLTYAYSNAKVDTQGHGFLGFATRTITDSRTGNVQTITSSQTFPFVGMTLQSVLKSSNGTTIAETDNTLADLDQNGADWGIPASTDRHFPYVTLSVVHDYDNIAGSNQETRTTTTTVLATDFDAFGNVLHENTVVADLTQGGAQYTTDQTLTYPSADPGNYCVGVPDSSTVQRTAPAGSLGVTFTDPATRTVTNDVDRTHCRLNAQTVTDGTVSLTTAYASYDSFGNVTETDVSGTGVPAPRVTQYSYQGPAGTNNEFPVSVTHVVSATDSITSATAWDYRFGIKTSETDPNGNVTSYGADDFGRPTTVTRPDGSQTSLSYNWCPNAFCTVAEALYEITTSQQGGSANITTGYTAYDDFGRPVEQGTVLLGGVMSKVDTTYDSLGEAIKVSKPYTGTQAAFDTNYTYDPSRGRLTEVDAPQDANDTCAPCQNVTTFGYSGFTVTTTHTVGNSASSSSTQVTSRTTDALGQVLNTVDANGGTTTYNYDAFGDLVATQDADNHLTTISYDGLGHKTGMVDPNMGTWSYQVDALGEILCQTDAKNQSIIMGYDNVGRLVSKTETAAGAGCNGSGTTSTWTYDTQAKGLGLPASVTDSNGFERDYAYDSLSRPSDITTTPGTGASQYTVSTTYDNFGRVQTLTYPASVTPAAGGTAPTAVATITTAVPGLVGTAVTLDGSGSTDPNGLGLQYQWSQTGGPTLNAGAFDSAAATPSFTPVAGGVYSFQLQVIDSGSALSTPATVSLSVKPPVYPAAPTVSPNPSLNGSVTLTWAATTYVDSFNVYQSTDNVNFTQVQTVVDNGTGTNSVTISGLGNGTYYFAIGSIANGVSGDRGVSASGLVTLPPGTPTGTNVTPSAVKPNVNFTVKWTAPASGLVTSYVVRGDDNSGFTSPTDHTVTGTSWVNSLGPVGTYYYKVKACNQTACSAFSNVDSVIVENLPSAPSLSANPANIPSGSSSTLSWSPNSSPITSYVLQKSATSDFSSPVQVYSGTARSISASPSATTYYRVHACNGVGCGGWSATATVHVTTGGGDNCNPICPLVMEDKFAATVVPGEERNFVDAEQVSPAAALAASELRTVTLPTAPAEGKAPGTLELLQGERQALVASSPLQPSEAALQARAGYAAPGLALAAPSARSPSLGGSTGPRYAPPVYQAYSGTKLQNVGGTPYRFTVQYNYDPASGALLSASNADTGFIYWRAATDTGNAPVDAFGHVIGYVDGNNVSTVAGYDQATGALTGISTGIGASTSVQQLAYSWDGFGNMKQRCDANRGLTETFTYDGLNRIATSTVNTGATDCAGGTPQSTLGMNYDAVGNITSRSNTGLGINDTYAYGDPAHPYGVTATGSGSYAYDLNGNMICRDPTGTSCAGASPTPNITWNDDNLPVTINDPNGNASTFAYSPDLQRYSQVTTDSVAGNSTTTYIGGLFEVVSTSSTTQYRHDIVADGQVVAVHTLDQSGTATTSYIHTDSLGSSDTITNDVGSVVQQSSFDAFGLRRDPSNWSYDLTATQVSILKGISDKGFTFQEQLDNVGLVHMNGRVYDPGVGRFISADPTVSASLYSQAFNRYAYVYNNPLSATDPSGYCPTGESICADTSDFPLDNLVGNYHTALNVRNEIDAIFSRSKRTQDAGEIVAAVIDDYFSIPWVEAGYAGYVDRLNGQSQVVAGRDFVESLAISESTKYIFKHLSSKFPINDGFFSNWWHKFPKLVRFVLQDTAIEYLKENFVRLKHEAVQFSKDLAGKIISNPLDPGDLLSDLFGSVGGSTSGNILDPGNLIGGLFGGGGSDDPPSPWAGSGAGGLGSYISHTRTAQK